MAGSRAKRVRRLAVRLGAGVMLIAILGGVVEYRRTRRIREALHAAFAPVRITNCELQRFGNPNDGGYLMCGNLLAASQSAYSYGINGEDAWGCDVAGPLGIPLHQYDCFNTSVPTCRAGTDARFHAECIGPERATIEDRRFDTFANHVSANGDTGKRLVVKMDVEGSEWRSLAAAPDYLLEAIDQMAVEFHEVEQPHFLETANRLNLFFYVAHVHYNNFLCQPGFDPFPGQVFEVLLVNKRIAVANPWVDARGPSPLDAPNNPTVPDCQAPPGGSEARRVYQWLRRQARGTVAAIEDFRSRATWFFRARVNAGETGEGG